MSGALEELALEGHAPARALFAAGAGEAVPVLLVAAGAALEREAARLAAAGHAVLAVDPGAAGDRPGLALLRAARAELCARESTEDVVAVGSGEPGTLALLLAVTSGGLAGVALLGAPVVRASLDADRPHQPLEMIPNLDCPLLALLEAGDGAEEQRALLETALAQAARRGEAEVLAGAPDGEAGRAAERLDAFLAGLPED
jgi:dienelactone hydrolase